jgi:hypothetical protein
MNTALRLGIAFLALGGVTHVLHKFYIYLSRPFPDYYEDF